MREEVKAFFYLVLIALFALSLGYYKGFQEGVEKTEGNFGSLAVKLLERNNEQTESLVSGMSLTHREMNDVWTQLSYEKGKWELLRSEFVEFREEVKGKRR
jgi:predicted metalloprotease